MEFLSSQSIERIQLRDVRIVPFFRCSPLVRQVVRLWDCVSLTARYVD